MPSLQAESYDCSAGTSCSLQTGLEAIFVLVTTVGALVYNAIRFFKSNDYLLLAIGLVLIVLAFFVSIETVGVLKRKRAASSTEF